MKKLLIGLSLLTSLTLAPVIAMAQRGDVDTLGKPSCSVSPSPSQGVGNTRYSLSVDIQNYAGGVIPFTCGNISRTTTLPKTGSFQATVIRYFPIKPGTMKCTFTVTNSVGESASCSAAITTIYPVEQITIDARSNLGSIKLKSGFLHGFQGPIPSRFTALVSPLKPKFWRMGGDNIAMYQAAKQLGVAITYGFPNGIASAKPWENWRGYEGQVTSFVQRFAKRYPLDLASVYWDIWNEPDGLSFWSGSKADFLELNKRAYNVIRSIVPNAKLIGPSLSGFDAQRLRDFLVYLRDNDLRYAAISWHEFEYPEAIPEHVKAFRQINDDVFKLKPNLKIRAIHIDEYADPSTHLIPGWAVGWFYYLTEANVDWISRACWDIVESGRSWSNCWSGLDGVLTENNQNPQGIYWVFKAFADMEGQRLQSTSNNPNNPRVVALATRDDSTKQIYVLAGRFYARKDAPDGSNAFFKDTPMQRAPVAPEGSRLTITNYPYGTAKVTARITIVPNEPMVGALLEKDLRTTTVTLPVSAGTITLPLDGRQDGEAYIAVITPTP